MYSPQQNLQPYAKVHPKQAGFPWRLLILTGLLLVLCIFIYASVSFGYRPYLETQITQVDAQLAQYSSTIQAQESDVFDVYSQLYNIQQLSNKHIYGSKIFTILESGTMATVILTKAEVDTAKNTLALEGLAMSYDAVVSQVSAFRGLNGVTEARLISTTLAQDGRVEFSVEMIMEKGYFNTP